LDEQHCFAVGLLGIKPWCRIESNMFSELLATYSVLKKWRRDSSISKAEIGVWSHWLDGRDENQLPLAPDEVARLKTLLGRHAPTSYRELFPEESFV
jgi:hypothetical protein